MIPGRAETEKPLPWSSEQYCSQFNLHLCVFYRVGSTERIQTDQERGGQTPGWLHSCHNNLQAAVTSGKASMQTVIPSSFLPFNFCLLFPCPLWHAFQFLLYLTPVCPTWSMSRAILPSPTHTHKDTVYSSYTQTTVLN